MTVRFIGRTHFARGVWAGVEVRAGLGRSCRVVAPPTRSIRYPLTYSVPRFLRRKCDRTPGLRGRGGAGAGVGVGQAQRGGPLPAVLTRLDLSGPLLESLLGKI